MPCNVLEDFLVGVKCEWEKESIFLEICTGHFPAQGLETIPDHCVVNESSHIDGRGMERVSSSDIRRFHLEKANRSQDSTEDKFEAAAVVLKVVTAILGRNKY